MKITKLIPIALFLLSITSCTSKYLIYDFKMKHPVESRQLEYENDTFSIVFEFERQTINFTILNKTNDGIKVNWDEVSFSVNGKAQRAVHKETGVYKISDIQPPTTIPPKSTLEDFLIPTDNVRYSNISNRTYVITKDIFPITATGKKKLEAAIKKYKGTKVTVFLPLYIGNKYQSFYYDIYIEDVRGSNTSKEQLTKEPEPKKGKKKK